MLNALKAETKGDLGQSNIATRLAEEFGQSLVGKPFLRDAGIPLWGIGIGVAAQTGLGAIGSWMSERVGARLGLSRVFWLMPVGSAIALVAAVPGTAWLFPLFIFPSLGWNVMYPHFTEYLARRTPEAVRASVISVSNLISGLLSVIVTPVVALGVDRIGFRPTLTALAASLVAVIADLHGAELTLADNGPGLRVTLRFPPPRSARSSAPSSRPASPR